MNRIVYLFTFLIILVFPQLKAQTILEFAISQPSVLFSSAGSDKVINKGNQMVLGSVPAASGGSSPYRYSWSPVQGLSNASISNPTATPDKTTVYTLSVNDNKNCNHSSSITLTVNDATGIQNMADELGLMVFPNPNNGSFIISSDKVLGKGSALLEIFNPSGKLIYTELITVSSNKLNKTVNLIPDSKGTFILRLSGNELNAIRIIIIN